MLSNPMSNAKIKEIFLGAFLESLFQGKSFYPSRFFKDARREKEFTTLEHKRDRAGDNWLESG